MCTQSYKNTQKSNRNSFCWDTTCRDSQGTKARGQQSSEDVIWEQEGLFPLEFDLRLAKVEHKKLLRGL